LVINSCTWTSIKSISYEPTWNNQLVTFWYLDAGRPADLLFVWAETQLIIE
jgi:hypothetical protein